MDERERELWRQADRILDALLDVADTQREARLREITADETLRTRVRHLLAAHARSGGPLDQPPPLPDASSAGLQGQKLGRWRLCEEIGRGGMAVVYRAVSEEGVQGQQAAVKVLVLGSLAQQGRERFLYEQQALLRLRHPYIAALYDAGVAADGTPWLAMQLVEGEPIDRWCDAHGLDVRSRIELLLQVCEALDYSHRNLVVHRDIKPSNVLVDGDGHVRVLDFGIARLLDEGDAVRTRTQSRALTPEYAAPEQFAGLPPSTAMDVYGVGALLYRLLAGTAPHGAQGAITTPSRSLRARAGAHASADLRLRIKRLRGDLDTVVMKALAERPEDRYAGVAALADDLHRWLAHRPIRARAPSLRYRLRKFVARNRWQVATAATLLLALATGIGAVLWQADRARSAAEESRAQLNYTSRVLEALAPSTEEARELDRSRLIAEAAEHARGELAGKPRLLASVELDLGGIAERVGDYAQALTLYDHAHGLRRAAFGEDSIETAEALARTGAVRGRLDPPQPDEAERRLREAETRLRRRAPASPAWIDTAQELAVVLGEQDRYPEAQVLLRDAAQACIGAPPPPESCERAWMAQGSLWARMRSDTDAAIAAYEKAHAARVARLGAEHADTLFVATLLGELYHRNGQRQRGLALLEQVYAAQQRIYAKPTEQLLTTLQKLAIAVAGEGQSERALALRQEHLAQARRLFGDDHPAVALSHADLGSLLFSEARFAEAEQAQRHAYAIYADYAGPGGAGALIVQSNLAEALREQGRASEALPLARQTVAGMEKLFGPDSVHVAGRLVTLARIESDLGAAAQAQAHAERAIAIFRATPSPGSTALEGARAARARVLLADGRAGEAEAELREVLRAIDASPGRTERAHWETFAALTEAACAARAADCPQLRDAVRAALAQPMPAIAHKRLRDALAAR